MGIIYFANHASFDLARDSVVSRFLASTLGCFILMS
jgi:hypothetical protein